MLTGVTPHGEPVEIRTDAAPLVLLFLTSSCLPCRLWWAELGTRPHPQAVIVTPDPATEDARAVAALDRGRVPVVMSSAAWFEHGVRGSPTAIVLRRGAEVARGEPHTWDALDALLSPCAPGGSETGTAGAAAPTAAPPPPRDTSGGRR